METSSGGDLTQAQNELYGWIKDYMKNFQHSPSIRQMMQAMGLKSPAPIQSRLKHLQEKGYISWQEGKARTMQIVDEIIEGVPIMGSVAAGGLIETYSDVQENLDISDVLKKKNVFALTVNGVSVPLLLIAIMTFILITSSGTMAMAVRSGYQKKRKQAAALLYLTAILGLSFVGMQAFEWSKLIEEGIRPWENPFGARQFGSIFFMVTGFHGFHVSVGVIFLFITARKVLRGDYDTGRRGFFTWQKGRYEIIETMGLYWHFVDLVWVFIFAFFYLW